MLARRKSKNGITEFALTLASCAKKCAYNVSEKWYDGIPLGVMEV